MSSSWKYQVHLPCNVQTDGQRKVFTLPHETENILKRVQHYILSTEELEDKMNCFLSAPQVPITLARKISTAC